MRWMLVAAVLAFSVGGHCAAETVGDEAKSAIDMTEAGQGVVVSAIPAPAPVIEVLTLEDPVARARSAKKLRLAKKKPLPSLMLTRVERRQMALLAITGKSDEPQGQIYNPDDSYQGGPDELVLHRSFSRPRVVDESNDEREDFQELSAQVRLRLLIARLKAVEAHALNQVPEGDEALSESVLQRLQEARMKAVQAHQKKFS